MKFKSKYRYCGSISIVGQMIIMVSLFLILFDIKMAEKLFGILFGILIVIFIIGIIIVFFLVKKQYKKYCHKIKPKILYELKKSKQKLFISKFKYYLIKNHSIGISLCLLIAFGLYIGLLVKYVKHSNAELILIPSAIGLLAILIGFGIYLRQLQSKIEKHLKEMKYLQSQTEINHLFYLLLKFYFIHSYLNYILGPKDPNFLISNYEMTLADSKNINYFQKFRNPNETWHQFYKRNFKKYDVNLIQKYPEFVDLLIKEQKNNDRVLNIYHTIQKFFIEMEIYIYTCEPVAFNKMKDRFKLLDLVGIKTLKILKFNIFEGEVTKITYNMLEKKSSQFGKYREQLGEIRGRYRDILGLTNGSRILFYDQLFYDNDVYESDSPKLQKSLLKNHKEICNICAKLLHYSESEYGTIRHVLLVDLMKNQKK